VGLSYPKYEVLKHLREASEAVSLGCLAEDQSCARSNITQLVDRLESEGLVRRVADPDDRRGVRAELTEEGVAREAEGTTQLNLVLAEFAASFSGPERAELGRLLSRLG
jgi:DNA-binding MarR family transcriptional regulator